MTLLTQQVRRNSQNFQKIPSLKSYPVIGHSYLFFPGGRYKFERLTEAFVDISKKLGPIFKLRLGGKEMVVTLNPEDSKILFQNEGRYPQRPVFEALLHYRKQVFNSIGVVPGNGEEWHKLRQGVAPLLQLPVIKPYRTKQLEIAKFFINYVKQQRDEHLIVHDLFKHLLRFTIEAISVVSPGYHFHCLSQDGAASDEIIKSSVDFMDGLYKTLTEPPLWKFWKTKGYKQLEDSHNTIYKILSGHLQEAQLQFRENPEGLRVAHPYMYLLFQNEEISLNDKIMLAIEVFLGGIDATATTLAFTLHYLSKNRDIQILARNSLSQNSEFLKACVKETLRLSPTAGGNSRFLANDAVFSGYVVPKGTLVLCLNSGLSRNDEVFKNANTYYPQRFMKETRENFHRFASLPFGYGSRMCPGRRLAETEMVILLAEILTNFLLEDVDEEEVGMIFRMNRIPDKAINIKFLDNEN